MYRAFAVFVFSSTAFFCQTVYANSEELKTLLNRNNCSACHLIDKMKYGPVLQEVAAKYSGDPSAVERIAAKIKSGGSGVWGEDMMPPQPNVSDADAKKMAELILKLEPK